MPIFAAQVDGDGDDDHAQNYPTHRSDRVTHDTMATKPLEVILSTQDKVRLVRPLVFKYMFWLFAVYVFEYVINTGVAPVLAFLPPSSGPWSHVFKSTRDFYPFWALTYQTFVFLSRSALTLGIPPIPRWSLPLPTTFQGVIFGLLYLQARDYIFSSPESVPVKSTGEFSTASTLMGRLDSKHVPADRAITVVFLLVCVEGLMGGLAYCMTFYHVGREESGDQDMDQEQRRAEREFRMGACGSADSLGILLASLISMRVETSLCDAQVEAGSMLCKNL